MRNIALTLSYDGTNYHGWQRQKNGITIQEVLENTLTQITHQSVTLTGCSRTDAGVHAKQYVANFTTQCRIPVERLPYACNCLLPDDIVVLHAEEKDDAFHARFCAKGKKYQYRILNRPFGHVFARHYSYHFPFALDFSAMQQAVGKYVGKHDFVAFMASGSLVKDTVREMYSATLTTDGDEIIFEISGNGFLYNMVRIMMGTLIEVGLHKRSAYSIEQLYLDGIRKEAGRTVPPQGLILAEVYYNEKQKSI